MDAVSGVAVPGWIIEKIRTSKEFKGKSVCDGDNAKDFSLDEEKQYYLIATELLKAKKGAEYSHLPYKKSAVYYLATKMKKQGAEQGHQFLALVDKSGQKIKCEKGIAVSFPRQLDLGLSEKDVDDAMEKGRYRVCGNAVFNDAFRVQGECPPKKMEKKHGN
jgi:hypothetical protein